MTVHPLARSAGLFLLTLLLGHCRGKQLVVACTSDGDCGPHFRCGTTGKFFGACLCADDQACPPGDAGPLFCNPQGLCQGKVGCFSNLDCASAQYCDSAAGVCVGSPACGNDSDCAFGFVCSSQLCVVGCRSTGDCPLGDGGQVVACVCASGLECQCPPPGDGGLVDPAAYDRSTCPIGTCNPNDCAGDTSVCPYNDVCSGSGDGGSFTCEPDPRSVVLCNDCVYNPGSTSACNAGDTQGANFCLLDLADPTASKTFCGVDCSGGQGCPSGYKCDDVIILTQTPCTSDQSCSPTGAPCTVGALDGGSDCPADTVCVGPTGPQKGRCGGVCIAGEGNQHGFCTCVKDSDCPRDACDTSSRRCTISQQLCDPQNSTTCGSVGCVDFGGARGCFIGRNCAPTHGLQCPLPAQQ